MGGRKLGGKKMKSSIRGGTREKGEEKQVVSYRTGDKTVGLDLVKSSERLISQLFNVLS